MESAITSIMDCEDAVSAVDAEDKLGVYKNWLGLIRGELTTKVNKGRIYTAPDVCKTNMPCRVLMLNRNFDHLLHNDSDLNVDRTEAYEGILDAVFTSIMAKHNLLGKGKYINSKKGSIYIFKPKML